MSSRTQGGERGTPVEAHDWLEALFGESPVAIGFAREGVVVDANAAYARLFGYASVGEFRGRSLLEQVAPSHRAQIIRLLGERAKGDSVPYQYQTRGLRQDGTEFPMDVTTARVVVADGPLLIAFVSDVSKREDALQALMASEERFRTLSGAAFEGVCVHADGKIVLANDAGAAMFGFEPASIVGVSLMDLTAPESRALVADRIRRAAAEPCEVVAQRKDGSTFVVEVRAGTMSHQGRPTRVAVVRDLTEHKRVEAEQRALGERIQQAQKLESLGVLAGGVAHDFNNILTVISNEAALLRRDASIGPAAVARLDAIALATERAADLCRQMLAYAGRARLEREPVDLGALVGEMSSMLEASIAKRATLVHQLAPGLPALLGDATQIRQVVMNLVLNASEAVSGPDGTICMSTGTADLDAAALVGCPAGGQAKSGPYVWLEVRDDGVGMDAATRAQMFDPFFTTKFMGRGLGMAAVLGIVRGHGGAIDVESCPERGTRVRVFFPACDAEPLPTATRRAEKLRGRGVVLLVDDEKNVRISTQLLLREFGFEVIPAGDGTEAIDALRSARGRIDAVLLDLTMPRMDGAETLRHLRSIAPEIPVVLTTGYGSAPLDDEPRAERPDAVLPKPYAEEELFATLRRVMRR
jgi:PAS domain S-box-containing protein